LGVADIKREGKDVTIVARSLTVPTALKAAEELEKQGVSCEVIDPRTIRQLDIDTIVESVKKTNRVVIAEESHPFCGVAAEISAEINERAFDYLDAPVKRVSGADVPMPYAKNLEQLAIPDVERIIAAVRDVSYLSFRLLTAHCQLLTDYGHSSPHAQALAHDGRRAARALAKKRRRQSFDGRTSRRDRYRQSDDGDAGTVERRAAKDSDP